MKKVFLVVISALSFFACKKQNIDPIKTNPSNSIQKKIVYSIEVSEKLNIQKKTEFEWNEHGRLAIMSAYIDSNKTGYQLLEERKLEYKNNLPVKYTLGIYKKGKILTSEDVNTYVYEANHLISYSCHSKSYNRTNGGFDYLNTTNATIINDTLVKYISTFKSFYNNTEKFDTTYVDYNEKNSSSFKAYFYSNYLRQGKSEKYGNTIQLSKNIMSLKFIDDDPSIGEFNIEFSKIESPFKDLIFYGTATDYSTRFLDDILRQYEMDNLPLKMYEKKGFGYDYEYIISSDGLLMSSKTYITDSTGRKLSSTTTYFY